METIFLNISGSRWEVSKDILLRHPGTRLAIISAAGVCASELKFDRQTTSFESILAFYQTGKLHMPSNVCPMAFKEELNFWGIDPANMDRCCYITYMQFMDKYKSKNKFCSEYDTDEFYNECPTVRQRIWRIIEYRESTLASTLFLILGIVFVLTTVATIAFSTLPQYRRDPYPCEWVDYILSQKKYREATEYVKRHNCKNITIKNDNDKDYNFFYYTYYYDDDDSSDYSENIGEGSGLDDMTDTETGQNRPPRNITIIKPVKPRPPRNITNIKPVKPRPPRNITNTKPVKPRPPRNITNINPVKHRSPVNNDVESDIPLTTINESIDELPVNDTFVGDDANIELEFETRRIHEKVLQNLTIEDAPTDRDINSSKLEKLEIFPTSMRTFLPDVTFKNDIFHKIDYFATVFFTIELILRLLTCPSLKLYYKSFINIIDTIVLIGTYADFMVIYLNPNLKFSMVLVDIIDFIKLLRIIRLLRYCQHLTSVRVLRFSIKHNAKDLIVLIFHLFLVVIIFAQILYMFENRANISSIPQGWWLGIITMTTVGYGDVAPKSVVGKLACSLCALSGILTLALITPIFVETFMSLYGLASISKSTLNKQKQKAALKDK